MIQASVPSAHQFHAMDVAALLTSQAQRRNEHPFLVWEPFSAPGRTWSYAAFLDHASQVAAGLAHRGVRAGDRVLILLENCPELLLTWYGCALLGAVAVTINARSAAPEVAFYAADSRARGAVTQPRFAAMLAGACPNLEWLAVTDTDCGDEPAAGSRPAPSDRFDALLRPAGRLVPRPADPAAPLAVFYTSGSSARPKGVVWTHANGLWAAKVNAEHEDLREDDIHLVTLPLYHINAQAYSVLATLWAGGTVVLQPRFSASRFWEVSLRHRCTWASLIRFCMQALAAREVPRSHFYRLWGAGISAPPTDALFGVKTIGWWGMTETVAHGIVGDVHRPNTPNAIGRPAPEYRLAILHADGTPVGPGETGELRIHGVPGLSLFAGYLNEPVATRESFDENGFFITGDRVTLLPDGQIRFADRIKDMMRIGGESVGASEIERVILAVPEVSEVAVVGQPDDMLGEVPVAFVVPREGCGGDALVQAVKDACAAQLADFKRPRRVQLAADLPRSNLAKIRKVELRSLLS